jgi:hypothetical protein
MKGLEPFNLGELVKYKSGFLSGFLSERYSIGLKEGWEKARSYINSRIKWGIERKINADEIRNLIVNTSYNNIKYKHILLPVWISAYTYKNKVYRYMVNGETGEVKGEAPVSPIKVGLTVLAVLAFLTIAWLILSKSGMLH